MLPSIYLGYDIVKKTMDNSSAEKFITENFDFDGTQIVQKTIDTDKRMIEVALLGKKISTADTKAASKRAESFRIGRL